jgi:sulfonate transport system substrate-binding protein
VIGLSPIVRTTAAAPVAASFLSSAAARFVDRGYGIIDHAAENKTFRRIKMRVRMLLAAAMAVTLGSAAANAQTPLKIRLSYIVPVSNWATMLFKRPELAPHLNKSYTFDPVHFNGTPQLITALSVGELDIANFGYTTLPLAITNAGMNDLRIISDELQDGVPGYYSNEFLVRKDGDIKTWADLKGKVVATNAYGSGTDVPLRVALAKNNLQDKRDLTIIETQIPTMPAMLADKKVELIVLPLPFTANPQVRNNTRTLGTVGEAVGINQLGMWVARQGFIEKNRAALNDFMEDVLRQQRWYFDPKNHDEAVKIAVEVTKQPPERWDGWLFKKDDQKGDYYRNSDGKPDIAALQKVIDLQVQYGFLKEKIDITKFVDLSLMDEAVKRLK